MSAPTQLPVMEPGSPDWLQLMTASKIAAVVGLSPYQSRFSLWHRMAGLIEQEPDSDVLRRGHYLEPAIAAWFADQHPDWDVEPGGTWVDGSDDRFAASPDRMVRAAGETRCLEIKSAADADEWGDAHTDDIPAGYKAQVQWELLCTGTQVCHVAVLLPYLDFREYVIRADAEDAAFLRLEAAAFLDSLPTGPHPQRPDIDSHNATYEAIRKLHPDIDDRKVEIDTALALRYLAAYRASKTADAELTEAKALLLDAMGDARRATYLDTQIAIRKPGRGGSVSLQCTQKEAS